MHEWKNREIIAGLVALIVLSLIAMFLIVKREINVDKQNTKEVNVASTANITSEAEIERTEENVQETAVDSLQNSEFKETQDSSFGSTTEEYYSAKKMQEYTEGDWQLEELYSYWSEYKLDAVADLIRLPRVRAITDSLSGTDNYYYYGDTDKNGLPHGNGLAIYAENTYYCGDFKHGMRDGEGMWLKIYPDKPVTVNGSKGVIEHSYNGEFANDYPNGKGQEHFEYDFEQMENVYNFANVIGTFKDGYYDGEMYIMTISDETHTRDWSANAKKGVFQPLVNRTNVLGKVAVWKYLENEDESTDVFEWMFPEENKNFGVYGLKK